MRFGLMQNRAIQSTHAKQLTIKCMKRDAAIAILKQYEQSLKSLGVKSLALFGSVARDEAHSESDIDILVEFSEPPTFDRYMILSSTSKISLVKM
jgi:predicted nucleotidyltransferase